MNKNTPLPSYVVWTLFDYLLSEMGSSAHEKGMRHDHKFKENNLFESLEETANSLGLKISALILNREQAIAASGHLAPLIRPLEDGRWLVLSGFRRGLIKTALIQGTTVEIRLLSLGKLAELLENESDRLQEWFGVELNAPMDASVHHEEHHLPPLQRLVEMMKVEKRDLWHVALLAVASGLLSLATPAAVQSLVNTVAMGGMTQPLAVLSIMLLIFLGFFGAVTILQSYIVELIQRRLFVRMAGDLAYRLPKVQWRVHDKNNGMVELVNRFFEILTLQKAGSLLMIEGFSMFLQSVIGLIVLAAYHPMLLFFDLIVIVWVSSAIFVQGRKGVQTAIDESIAKYSMVAWLETLAANSQTFKFSGGPELARERTDKLAYDYLNTRRRHYRILLKQHINLYALYAVASTTLLAVGGYLVMQGQLSLGQLIAAEIIVSGVLVSFSKLKKQLESYYDLMAGVDKLGHLLDLPVERENGEVVVFKQAVSVRAYDVMFNYPGQPAQKYGFNFTIKAGEQVALIGEMGIGKSTLTQLLTGLREPCKGHIEIAERDIRELHLESLRAQIAVVGYREIIEDSILENIRLGRPEISVTDVRELLKRLDLMVELDHIPEGIYTQLNMTGSPLSTTQVRKLLLARALISQPRLLIVDSLLDEWPNFYHSAAKALLFSPDAPWTLLVLTSFPEIAQYCQRSIELTANKI